MDMYSYLEHKGYQEKWNSFLMLARKKEFIISLGILSILLIIAWLYIANYSAPKEFPKGEIVIINDGSTLKEISHMLEDEHIIGSPFLFRSLVTLMSAENSVQAGYYMFNEEINVYEVARRVIDGKFDILPQKITIPEGTNVFEIAAILDDVLESFDTSEFIKIARAKEGYLFPDTYFFNPGTKPEQVIDIMEHTFWKKIDEVKEKIDASDKSLSEIIIMASIIEREAYSSEERRVISGILWKRIEEGMPLQVDAAFSHVNGKGSYDLTMDDLTSKDSPYNTYTNLGLPPGPISNPGLDAIEAALEPEDSSYYFYLHGKNGDIHYASTFENHKANRVYLD